MKTFNLKNKIRRSLETNPELSSEQIGVLLGIDALYEKIPEDLKIFRERYAHMDPTIISRQTHGVRFLKIVKLKTSPAKIKSELNDYINIKFNYLGNYKSYEANMKKFKNYSLIISKVIDEILMISALPSDIVQVLQEDARVGECHDFYALVLLYRSTSEKRIKFEILRKIGLIVLLSRINRTFLPHTTEPNIETIRTVFFQGLGLKKDFIKTYFLWLDEQDKVNFCTDSQRAKMLYQKAVKNRKKLAKEPYPLQKFSEPSYKTQFGNHLLHIEFRNKLQKNNQISYTSFMEKVIRKNLEFPKQIHDLLGVKIVVQTEKDIPKQIANLEQFLGGTSTRKQEKNALHKFGKRSLGKYSSKDYFVWKAIYDIALPHPSIQRLERMKALTKGIALAQKEANERIEYFRDNPQDFVVEVQLQDIKSYLMSIAKGSLTDHDCLKTNQVLSNSFYKFFPKEIYEPELCDLKKFILKSA